MILSLTHQNLRPLVICSVGAAGYFHYRLLAVASYKGLITAEKVGVIFRTHTAAAAPVFVAHAEILELPRLFTAVFASFIGKGRPAVKRHIFDPVTHLLHCAAAYIAADVRLCSQKAA